MVEEVVALKRQTGKNISLSGISISQEFMNRGLIDEYWLAVQPVICGSGRVLFKGLRNKMDVKLVDMKTFTSGVVVLHYKHK
jgi:dihydrofolate reductase